MIIPIKNNKIEFDDVSSWTPFIKEAEKFARTMPGYTDSAYFDYEYALQVKQEGVSGFCGIIMSTNIPAYSAIDLRGTGLAAESELILPKGVYQIKIEDIIRPLSEMLKTTTLDEIIQKHIKINGQSDFFSDLLKSKVFNEYSPSDVSTKTREYIWEIYGKQHKTFADKVKYETDGYFQQITFQIEPISYYPFNVFVFFPENIKKQIIKKVAPFVKKSIDKLVELRKEHEFEKGKRNLLINFDIDTEFFEIIPNAEEYINRVHNNGYVGKIIKELTSRENNKKIKSEKDLTKRMKQIQRLYETII